MTSTVTAAAVSKNFGAYQDAAVREPVIITKNGRPRTVLMAYEDYVRLAKRDRRVDLTADLRDEDIAAIEASTMEPGYDHLNVERLTATMRRLSLRSDGFSGTHISGIGNIWKDERRATKIARLSYWRSLPRWRMELLRCAFYPLPIRHHLKPRMRSKSGGHPAPTWP